MSDYYFIYDLTGKLSLGEWMIKPTAKWNSRLTSKGFTHYTISIF